VIAKYFMSNNFYDLMMMILTMVMMGTAAVAVAVMTMVAWVQKI